MDSTHLGARRRPGAGLAMHHGAHGAPIAPGAMNAFISST
jgi:hypothetical protein